MKPRSSEGPWKRVDMDLQVPFPRFSFNNVHLLVFQDDFTKWVEILAIRVASARVITDHFKRIILHRYEAPDCIFSDNGTPFINRAIARITQEYNIKHIRTPPYHAQASSIERTNRDSKQLQQTYVEEMGEFSFAINTSKHVSTVFTPALLNFGRELQPTGTQCSELDAGLPEVNGNSPSPSNHVGNLKNEGIHTPNKILQPKTPGG